MEYFDVYARDGEKLDKAVPRGTKLKAHEYFLVVHIWVHNNNHQYLVQKRAKKTDRNPGLWATTSGLVLKDENPLEAARRELYEELSIATSNDALSLVDIVRTDEGPYRTITHVYRLKKDVIIEQLTLETEEVAQVQWLSLERIEMMANDGLFWDYRKLLRDPDYFKRLE